MLYYFKQSTYLNVFPYIMRCVEDDMTVHISVGA